jgi:dTDP-D-glucose 4,6-dehydratase
MKLLVVGGCGYIGTHFIDSTKERFPNIQIVVVDSDDYSGSVIKRNDVHFSRPR